MIRYILKNLKMFNYSLYHKIICLFFTGYSLFLEEIRQGLIKSFIINYISATWIDRALTMVLIILFMLFLHSWLVHYAPTLKIISLGNYFLINNILQYGDISPSTGLFS